MKAKFLVVLFAAAILASCKNDKAETPGDAPATEAPVDNFFKVTLSLISEKNDTFLMYYTEDGTTNFSEKPISVDLGGMPTPQQVIYKLPEEAYPTQLRLDFGMNKEQKDLTLQSVTLEYKGNKKVIAGADLANYFRADESKCTFDAASGKITAKVIDGVRQFPSLYPQEETMKKELENLAK